MQKPYVGRKIKYPNFVNIAKIKSNETIDLRYDLHIPFYTDNEAKELVVIMKNPSSATTNYCDTTISRVCNVAYHHGYSGVIILNLFPVRATYANQVVMFYVNRAYKSIMAYNLQLIKSTCRNRDVVFAWGTNTINRNKKYQNYYNQAIINVTSSIVNRTYYVDKCSCKSTQCSNHHPLLRFPLHGLRWRNNSKMIKY